MSIFTNKHVSSPIQFTSKRVVFKKPFFKAVVAVMLLLVLTSQASWGQLIITTAGVAVTQNFDGLPSTGTALAATGSIFSSGWSFLEAGTGANTTYDAGTGSVATGNTYDFGILGTNAVTDRAFGMLQSSSLTSSIVGFKFTNNTGSTVTSLIIGYTGEEWRTAAATDNLAFSYQLADVALNAASGWTVVAGLAFATPVNATATIKDGNATANRTVISPVTISGLSIANGTTVTLRWVDATGSSSAGMGIDDFSITAIAGVSTPTISTTGTLSAVNTTYGTASASPSSFSVSGANMSAGITVTPPAGYEVSQTSISSGYAGAGTAITVGAAGTIAATTVYVRLAATATVAGSPYSGNIVLSSTSATSVNVATASSTVTAKGLTITNLTGANKPYDGNTSASFTGTAAYSGLVNSESFSVTGTPAASFANATVANGKTITVSGYTAPSTNYTVSQPSLTGNITAVALTITAGNQTVSYGTLAATVTGAGSYVATGFVNTETASVIGGTASYTTNYTNTTGAASSGITITPVVTSLTATNYSFTPADGTITISKANSTITVTGSNSYVYDGLGHGPTTANTTGSGGAVTYSYSGTGGTTYAATATLPTEVGTYQVEATLAADANYNSAVSAAFAFTITSSAVPAITSVLTASATYGVAATTYTITASNTPTSYSATGLPAGLSVNTSTGDITGTATAAPGAYNVTIGAINAGGTGTATLVYTILAKTLTLPNAAATTKEYNRNNVAAITGTLSGIVNSDDVTLIGTGTFSQIGVGTVLAVASTSTLGGTKAAYYTLTQPTGLTADITAKGLTVTSASVTSKIYTGTNPATITGATLSGVISPDVVTLVAGANTFNSVNVGTGIGVTTSYTLTGADNGNYSLAQPTLTGNITTATLTITGVSGVNRVYDGSITATVTGTPAYNGLVSGDVFGTVSGSPTFSFSTPAAANGKPITITGGYTAPSGNYTVTQPTLSANITAKALTMSGLSVPASKTYDGTTTAVVSGTAALQSAEAVGAGTTSDGIPYTGDAVSITGTATGTYNNANVASATTVSFGGLSLTGAQSGNYSLTIQSPQAATITKASQTITFAALANQTTATVVDYTPGATSATSGINAITYTSSNTAVATILGGLIHIVGAGTTNITASQASSANYNAAADVLQSLTVTNAPVVLAAWDFSPIATTDNFGASPYAVTTKDANVTVGGLTRGTGFGAIATAGVASAWGATNFTVSGDLAGEIAANKYYTFTITANAGKLVTLTNIAAYNIRRSGSGPTTGQWQYQIGSGSFVNIGSSITWGGTTSASGNAQAAIVLSGIADLSEVPSSSTITLRLVSYGATNSGGTNYLKDLGNTTANDLIINGVISIPATPPTLTADATANTVDNNIDITFTDDATWRSKITAVKVGATALTATTDYVINAGNIQLKPSGLNALLTASGSKAVTVVATGYTDATVTQVINAGVPTANSTATIDAILAPNVSRTITCTAKDQYSNLVSGYNFKYDATIVSADPATTESYTIDGTAITATANDNVLSTITNVNGVATFTTIMPAILDANDGLSLQVQLSNGTTNVGTAFAYHELPGQTITFGALSAVTYGDAAFTISATGGASGNPVIFTSSDPSVATCTGTNGATITILKIGSTIIHANQAGNVSYNAAAQVNQTLTVNTKGLTITGLTGVSRVYNGTTTATFTGTPAYSGLVNSENFAVTGTAAANFSDANVGTGKTITVTGYTAPSANYTLTQPTLTADITQASQTISFGSLPNRVLGGASFSLTLNASSGLAISYSSSDPNVASISGNTVTIVGLGTTTITASQVGNSNYAAAIDVLQTQTILAVPIAGWDFTGAGSYVTFAATTFAANLVSTSGANNITRGSTAPFNPAANAFSTTGFQNNGISTANTDYFEVTLTAASGYHASVSAINANFDGTASFYATPGVTSQYAYSLDGTNFTLIGSPVTSTSLKPAAVDISGVAALQNVAAGTTITIRYYASGQTTTGGWRFYSPSAGVNGLAIQGSLNIVPTTHTVTGGGQICSGGSIAVGLDGSESGINYQLKLNGTNTGSVVPGTGAAISFGSQSVVGTYTVEAVNATTSANAMMTGSVIISLYAAPSGIAFTPTSGYTGTTVIITGSNFNGATGASAVKFGGTNATSYNVDNPGQITAVVNTGTTGVVTLTNANCTGNSVGIFTHNGYITNASGDWNTGATWLGGNVPPAGATVTIAHAVILSASLTNTGIIIVNTAGTLTTSSAITNNGTLTVNGILQLNEGGAVTGTAIAYGALSTLKYAGTSAQTTTAIELPSSAGPTNLTITNASGVNAANDFAIAGILNLNSNNPSATNKGSLDMSSYTLTMGASATTTGAGDVTGIVKRTSFVLSTVYTFGNSNTTLKITAGTMPTSVSIKTVLTTSHSWNSTAIDRYYDLAKVGGGTTTKVVFRAHYLDSEFNGNTENQLDFYDYHVSGTSGHDHGHSDSDPSENWLELANLGLNYLAPSSSFDDKYWIMSNSTMPNFTWLGAEDADWSNANNWSGHVVPISSSNVIIPGSSVYGANAATILPSLPTTSVNSITIQSDGTLNAGSSTITLTQTVAQVSGSSWENDGTFNAESGMVIFANTQYEQTIGGQHATTFNNLTINGSASVSMGKNVTVGGTLSLSTGSILEIKDKTLTVAGPVSGSGAFKGSANSIIDFKNGASGTLNMDIADAASSSLSSLTVEGTANISLGTSLNIYDVLSLTGTATLDLTGKNLTLKSNVTGTARVADLTGRTLSNATNVTVERYLANPKRAWHLLSAQAVTGSETILHAWQENGGTYVAGQGEWITSNLYSNSPSNGFDATSASASILPYKTNGTWDYTMANTDVKTLSSEQGYMLYGFGDRNDNMVNSSVHPTVIRATGQLNTGTPVSVSVPASASIWTLVGNPYASPLDVDAILTTTNMDQLMYVWDPTLAGNYGLGGYVLVDRNGGTYQRTPFGGSASNDATSRYIHSGQAFFVKATNNPASVSITESMKSSGLSVVNPIINGATDQQIYTNLMIINPDNSASLADGIRVRFDDTYTAATTDDILKFSNSSESIASYRDGKRLIVERRPMINNNDTVFLRITSPAIKNYRLVIASINFNQPGVTAFLQDNYLGTITPITLNGSVNNFDFSVTAVAASASPDRFRIVFGAPSGPLPINFTSIKAYQQGVNVAVEWKLAAELGVKNYEIEKSTNGTNFNKVGTQLAMANNGTDITYNWLDVNPAAGNNFYRIRSIENSGMVKYSSIAKVNIGKLAAAITVYPNPVTGKQMSVQFIACDKGLYNIKLINNMGQSVYTTSINHTGGNATQSITLEGIAAGNYYLKVIKPDQSNLLLKVNIAN